MTLEPPSSLPSPPVPLDAARRTRVLQSALETLQRDTRARAAVFIGLAGLPAGGATVDVGLTGCIAVGPVPTGLTRAAAERQTLAELGWSAADLMPVDGPHRRRMAVPGGAWEVAGGLVAHEGRVLGWLGLEAGPLGLPSRRRLLQCWRLAAEPIGLFLDPAGQPTLPAAALVMQHDGTVWAHTGPAQAWLDVPGMRGELKSQVSAFLSTAHRTMRLGTLSGVVHLERLGGQCGAAALVRLLPFEPLHEPIYGELSPRQLDVCRLASGGATSAEVASALGLGFETVRTHLKSAYRRLGVANRFELAGVLQQTWPERTDPGCAVRLSG